MRLRLRRRKVMRSCDPVLDTFKPVTPVNHSTDAQRCGKERKMRGCETWIDYLVKYDERLAVRRAATAQEER